MSTIKVRTYVEELTNVMLEFTHNKVYRSATIDGVYSEITTPLTIVPLVVDQYLYEYIDITAPSSSYWYKTSFYHDVNLTESDLSAPRQGSDAGLYCTVQQLRDEGITTAELSDDRAMMLIIHWQAWIDKMTGQFFTMKELTLDFDGDGSRMLLLPVPIIECTALYINCDFTNAVSTDNYTVYSRRGPVQDDRRNPKIKLKFSGQTTIYSTSGYSKFTIGDLNQRVVGSWGYVEPDGSTPSAINRAIKILVTLTKDFLDESEIDQFRAGRVIEEVTDRHRIEYSDLYNRLKTWAPTGITEVDMALASYRSPMTVTAPRNIGCYV